MSKDLINWILKFSSHYICYIPFTIGICSYANGLPDKWKHIDARWKAYVNMLYLQPDYKQTKITRVFHQWEFLGIANKSPWCVLKNAKICIVIKPKKAQLHQNFENQYSYQEILPSRHSSFKVNIRSIIPWKKRKSVSLNLERYPAKQWTKADERG